MKKLIAIIILLSLCNIIIAQNNKVYYSIEEALKEPNEVKTLRIQQNIDPNIIGKSLIKFNNLEKLIITGNKLLDKIPEEINSLTNLTSIELSNNGFTELPDLVFKLNQLRYLDIRNNKIKLLSNKILELKNLKELNISNNQITQLPEELWQLKQLEHLNISLNPISEISEEIGNLKKLKHLTISQNPILELPMSIGSLIELESFVLTQTNIEKLPTEIGNLKALNSFTLEQNKIMKLPQGFGGLKELKYLSLWEEYLNELPDTIGGLRKLEEARIIFCPLRNIPESIGNWTKIKSLAIGHTKINKFPASIGKCIELEDLNLCCNKLITLPKTIKNLKKLKSLSFMENPPMLIEDEEWFRKNIPEDCEFFAKRMKKTEFEPITEARPLTQLDEIKLKTLQGEQVSLEEVIKSNDGKPVLVMTYAPSWCAPCENILNLFNRNYLKDLREEYGLKVIAINLDKKLNTTEIKTRAFNNSWWQIDILNDPESNTLRVLEINHAPSIFIIKDDVIKFRHNGFLTSQNEANKVPQYLKAYINEIMLDK